MSLTFSDTIKLSWSNIAQHKKRSILIVATIALLFGVIMAFNFILQGLRNTILDAALQTTSGQIYLETGYAANGSSSTSGIPIFADQVALDTYVDQSVTGCHGEVVGTITTYQINNTRWVIDQSLAERFGPLDLSLVTKGKIPYLAPSIKGNHFTSYLHHDGHPDDRLVQVGTYPVTETGSPTLPGFNPLNLLLGLVHGSSDSAPPLIVDDGSGKVDDYILALAQERVTRDGYETVEQLFETRPPETRFVAAFDSYEDALDYYQQSQNGQIATYVKVGNKVYYLLTVDIFGNNINLSIDFDNLQTMLIMLEIILIIVAVIIATLTLAHLIDSDASTTALYRAVGASTGDIYWIYFLYLLELCLLAVLACLAIAVTITGILWLINASALSTRLEDFYVLAKPPSINLFGINQLFFWTIFTIPLIAPLALLLALRHFSPKYIAKNLKDD